MRIFLIICILLLPGMVSVSAQELLQVKPCILSNLSPGYSDLLPAGRLKLPISPAVGKPSLRVVAEVKPLYER